MFKFVFIVIEKKIVIVDDDIIVRKGVIALICDWFSTFITNQASSAVESLIELKKINLICWSLI